MQQQSLKCPSRNTTNLPQIYPILHPTVLLKPGISGLIPGVSGFRKSGVSGPIPGVSPGVSQNPEFPGLYPEFRPESSKPGVSGLIPGVSGLDSIFAPKTEISIVTKPTHKNPNLPRP